MKDSSNLFLVADGAFSRLEERRAKMRYFNDPVLWANDYLGIKP